MISHHKGEGTGPLSRDIFTLQVQGGVSVPAEHIDISVQCFSAWGVQHSHHPQHCFGSCLILLPHFSFSFIEKIVFEKNKFFFFLFPVPVACRVNKPLSEDFPELWEAAVCICEADTRAAGEVQSAPQLKEMSLCGPRGDAGLSLPVLTPHINHPAFLCLIWHCHVFISWRWSKPHSRGFSILAAHRSDTLHCLGVVSFLHWLLGYFKAAYIICYTKHENNPLGGFFFSVKGLNSNDRAHWGNTWTLLWKLKVILRPQCLSPLNIFMT